MSVGMGFFEYEQNVCDLPGIHFDQTSEEDADEIWLTVAERTCTTIVLDHEHENQKHG
jgi:hypothetical protein